MSKSSEKPRLHQIPSEDMDSEDGGTSPPEPADPSRARADSAREVEPTASKSHEEQINLQHALILNQVGKHNTRSHMRCKQTINCVHPPACRWRPNISTRMIPVAVARFSGLAASLYIEVVVSLLL